MFDANTFLNATIASPMSTQIAPVPEGEWRAMVDDGDKYIDFREVDTKNGPRPIATVWFKIVDDACRAKAGRENIRVKQDIWLDMENGTLATSEGKNVRIGQLRAALGQNDGQPWSFGRLRGAGPVIVKTVQRPNEKDPTAPFSEVERVLKIA